MCNVLYGLIQVEDCAEARTLLAALAPKIAGCADPFSAKQVGNALYGLHRHGEAPAASAVLAAFLPKVAACAEKFSGLAIGNSLHGLQRFPDSAEVTELFTILSKKASESTDV